MPTMRTEPEASKVCPYEQCREEKIKENLQMMQNLGIFKLKSESLRVKRPYRKSNSVQKPTTPLQPSRRSSRLENSTPVIYTDGVNEKGKKCKRESVVVIGEGPKAEIYTEEHEKLLGNTERSWTCFVDGYDKDGKRIYDPFKGKTCHQCRQKTLGHRTHCSECDMVQGQFCGDCLFMRYGEHVLEALENPNWVCPVCRGICNCSLCRNGKGWVPTGPIYRRIAKDGYKSVAHFLIQTKRSQTDDATPNQASAKRSLSFQEAKPLPKIAAADDLSEEIVPMLQKEEEENTKENPDSARRSLSFVLPSVDDHTPLVDVQVTGYYDPPKQNKQEHSCANIGNDDLPRIQEKTGLNSNLDTRVDSQLLVYDKDKVICNGTDIEGTSANTGETRTSSKRKASLEANLDSIGGRLRQRRTSQSGF